VSRVFSALLLATFTGKATDLPLLVGDPSPFVAWDGQWYLHIAATGYHAKSLQSIGPAGGHHDFAFYPGWPLLIRIFSLDGRLDMSFVGVVLSNVLFVLAAIVVFKWMTERFSERTAVGGVLLLAFNPVSYVFSMAYTESLFVLIAAAYFLTKYRPVSIPLAGLSMLVRTSGLAIGASAGIDFLLNRDRDGRLKPFLAGAAVFFAFAAWWVYIWQLTGNFRGWLNGSASWSRYEGVLSIARDAKQVAPFVVLWLAFVALMIGGSLLMYKKHPDLAIYGLVAIGLSLIGAPASSMPRHSMVAFPAFAAISERVGPRTTAIIAVFFAVGEILFAYFAFGPVHRPP
jgi:Gpi18-like mannosyltransferase